VRPPTRSAVGWIAPPGRRNPGAGPGFAEFGGTTRFAAVKRDRRRLAISAASRVVPIRSGSMRLSSSSHSQPSKAKSKQRERAGFGHIDAKRAPLQKTRLTRP